MTPVALELELNGRTVACSAWPHQTLLEVLRDELGATDVKYGCGEGICGTCTVLLDGEPVNACLMFGIQAAGRKVTTVKGLARGGAEMHPIQRSFLENGAAQCGFCTPGMLLTAYAFVEGNEDASREQIREALSGNLCRCTGYTKLVDAVAEYASAGRGPSR
ncbi:MAG: (2Fe-2S)-binding protein [Actinomycetota bacterium]|nr:(2Fe-2S)-binding protein [Actinomycetota bacterium]